MVGTVIRICGRGGETLCGVGAICAAAIDAVQHTAGAASKAQIAMESHRRIVVTGLKAAERLARGPARLGLTQPLPDRFKAI
jgi:hypothetical protein